MGAKVILEAQPQVKPLLEENLGLDAFIAQGKSLPHADFYVPLLSVPGMLWKTHGPHAHAIPYIRTDRQRTASWRERVHTLGTGLKIGVAWAGNPDHANDRNRSMRFDQLQPLFALDNVKWISLQKNGGEKDSPEEIARSGLIDWTNELTDYAATASLIECLDLIVSVDTSVAHLAGAMDKLVCVMIPFAPDWRWMLERPDSVWYPSMRLFRQRERGNWATVISTVFTEIEKLTLSQQCPVLKDEMK